MREPAPAPLAPRAALTVLALLLAGCASTADAPAAAPTADGARVEGVVVSSAIVPLEGAAVALLPAGRTAVSDAEGRFAFEGVPEGEHFVTATREGYIASQTTVSVQGGASPPLVQVVLDADRAVSPYVEAYSFEGYLDFSMNVGPVSGSASGLLGGEPALGTAYTLASRLPDWVQAEMVWTATGATSQNMMLVLSPQNETLQTVAETSNGPSPLLLGIDRTVLEEWDLQGGELLAVTSYVGNNTPEPAPSAGLAAAQPFEVFTHLFYGYKPPEGWRFSVDGEPRPPA